MERLLHRFKATYDPGFHIQMLLDHERVTAFASAIREVIVPGDVVVDAGAGSGVLSLLAAQAGARRVYAIEMDEEIASYARRNILASPYAEQITLVPGDATQLDLPEAVDVALGEMLHAWLVEEAQAPAMRNLKCFLKSGGRMIPSHVENLATLVQVDLLQPGCPLLSPFHLWDIDDVTPAVLSDRVLVDVIDLGTLNTLTVDRIVTFQVRRPGAANAVALDSRAQLTVQHWLGKTRTLFPSIYIPLPEPVPLVPGERIQARFCFQLGGRWTEVGIFLDK